jgi:hypothetical protein
VGCGGVVLRGCGDMGEDLGFEDGGGGGGADLEGHCGSHLCARC